MHSRSDRRSPLERGQLQQAAGPRWEVELLASSPSTNAVAASAARAGLVVVADHQTAGRGRLDRAWVTPPASALTFSIVLDPRIEARWWPVLPLLGGLAVAEAIGPRARLKWPNDVLVDDAKICGILMERICVEQPLAVMGIGLNVAQTREELPVETATSLHLAGVPIDRTTAFGRILAQLDPLLVLLRSDPQALMAAYRECSSTLGRRVRVELPGQRTLEGDVCDIDPTGELILRPSDGGDRIAVAAGDIVHLRPLQ